MASLRKKLYLIDTPLGLCQTFLMTVKWGVVLYSFGILLFFSTASRADQAQLPKTAAMTTPLNDQDFGYQIIMKAAHESLGQGFSEEPHVPRLDSINVDLDRLEGQLRGRKENYVKIVPSPPSSAPAPALISTPSPPPPPWWKKVNIHGDVETLLARHLYGSERYSEIKNQVMLDGTGEINDSLHYRVSGRVYYDAAYDQGYYPKAVDRDQKTLAELRDTYIDYSLGPWDLRLGKQEIVWGESAGVFVADVVNAEDLREFLLPDFDLIRIPEWGSDLEYTHNNFHSEFVFIPVPQVNKLGLPGSEFAFPYPVPPGSPYNIEEAKKPGASFENAKYGARFSYLLDDLDLGAFYLHSWTENPVFYRSIDDTGTFDFAPAYKRLDTLGATFSDTFADTVVRGEMSYNRNNYFSTSDPFSDGVSRSDSMEYALGADHTFFEKNIVGIQFIQNVIFDYNRSFVNERSVSNYASLSWQRDFLNHKLTTEFFTIAGLEDPDFMYRPDIKYNVTNNWQIKLGLDIFSGHPNGLFSEFRNKSRYYCESDLKF